MIYILTALRPEADGLIKQYQLKKVKDKPFEVFSSEKMKLVVSGVGKINAAAATSYILSDSDINYNHEDFFLNFGICGTLKKELTVGEMFLCNKVLDYETKECFFSYILLEYDLEEETIQSIDHLHQKFDFLEALVDMEASSAFKISSKFLNTHQIYVVKIVSDLAYKKNNEKLSKQFVLEIVDKNINKVVDFIDKTVLFLKSYQMLFQKRDSEFIEMLSISLNLTFSQKEQLKNAYCFYKANKGCEPSFLEEFLIIKPKNSKERNAIFDQIKQKLYS